MPRVVVIVDDTDSVASSLALAFRKIADVEPVVVHRALAALHLFKAPDSKIAAIVTDLNLPDLDGFELIREIRNLDSYRNLPAIIISADENAAKRRAPAGYAPNAVFRKPCSMREVSRVLEQLLV